jgi:fluoroquinolone resistance protein
MAGAIFENTILEKADFRTAYNYTIDPVQNRIKKAKFSVTGIAGLLSRYDIAIE